MNEDQLRALVRDAVARHLARDAGEFPIAAPAQAAAHAAHASHFRYALPESGGPCVIEPNVPCNHCGYCESHGH